MIIAANELNTCQKLMSLTEYSVLNMLYTVQGCLPNSAVNHPVMIATKPSGVVSVQSLRNHFEVCSFF